MQPFGRLAVLETHTLRVREYLNHVVQKIRWADRLDLFNHCPHFPFFMMPFIDSMPIGSIRGIWCADVWNPMGIYGMHHMFIR